MRESKRWLPRHAGNITEFNIDSALTREEERAGLGRCACH